MRIQSRVRALSCRKLLQEQKESVRTSCRRFGRQAQRKCRLVQSVYAEHGRIRGGSNLELAGLAAARSFTPEGTSCHVAGTAGNESFLLTRRTWIWKNHLCKTAWGRVRCDAHLGRTAPSERGGRAGRAPSSSGRTHSHFYGIWRARGHVHRERRPMHCTSTQAVSMWRRHVSTRWLPNDS